MPRGPRVTHQAPESQPPLTPRTRGSLLGVRVAIVGSGFAGSLLARILAVQGHGVALLERGTHPRFAIGESSTPLANLTLERLARRYGLGDCYDLAAHGRWIARFPELRRGLKRAIPSRLNRMHTHAGLLFSHFDGVRLMPDVVPGLPAGPYPDDWAAVHHIIEEGWLYSLRFDDGVTSAGFLLRDRVPGAPEEMWRHLLRRYPTIGALFGDAKPLFPLSYKPRIQHRLARATGP